MSGPTLAHGPEGYRVAVLLRSAVTVLVEGRGDKIALAQMLQVRCSVGSTPFDRVLIDDAQILKPPAGCLGNREVVEHVHSLLLDSGVPLTSLVDREFRAFDPDAKWRDTLGTHYEATEGLFWTRGHSIENYLLSDKFVERYVWYRLAPHVTSAHVSDIGRLLPIIRRWACAFSVAAMQNKVLRACSTLPRREHWRLVPSGIRLDLIGLENELASRDVESTKAAQVAADALRVFDELDGADAGALIWLPHGHILMAGLWSAVSRVLENGGMDPGQARLIGSGHEERFRYLARLWAEESVATPDEVPSPKALWSRVEGLLSR